MTNHVPGYVGDSREEDVNDDDHNGHDEQQLQPESSDVVLDIGHLSFSHTNDPLPSSSASESSDVVLDVEQLSSSVMKDPLPSPSASESSHVVLQKIVLPLPRMTTSLSEERVTMESQIQGNQEIQHNQEIEEVNEEETQDVKEEDHEIEEVKEEETQDVKEKDHEIEEVKEEETQDLKEDDQEIEEVKEEETQVVKEKDQEIEEVKEEETQDLKEKEHEIEEVKEDEAQDLKEKEDEIEEVKEDGTQDLKEKDQEIQKVMEKETQVPTEKDQLFKKMKDWWGNTRNIMAMVAILFVTLSITASFAPPPTVLKDNVVAIIFIIAVHLSLMTSMAVLFFLFSITATDPDIEKRLLQVSNLGLWSSLLGLTVAYISNIWMLGIHGIFKIILIITTTLGFLLLFSFFYSRKVRSKILHETSTDVAYILTEIFNAQDTGET